MKVRMRWRAAENVWYWVGAELPAESYFDPPLIDWVWEPSEARARGLDKCRADLVLAQLRAWYPDPQEHPVEVFR